jgi:nucleolar protein 6
MPVAEAKLTKKQKKALAFRSRTHKTNGASSEAQAETLPRPALEGKGQSDDKRLALEVGWMEEESPSVVRSDDKGKGRVDCKVESTKAQKRKRETSDDDDSQIKEQKKVRKEESQGKKERLILFVGKHLSAQPLSFADQTHLGNLKYTTAVEGIREHFSSCGRLFIHTPGPPPYLSSKILPQTCDCLLPKPLRGSKLRGRRVAHSSNSPIRKVYNRR